MSRPSGNSYRLSKLSMAISLALLLPVTSSVFGGTDTQTGATGVSGTNGANGNPQVTALAVPLVAMQALQQLLLAKQQTPQRQMAALVEQVALAVVLRARM